MVMMNQPIQKAMSKPNAARLIVQWEIELSQFDIVYRPRTAIKSQALANFISEFTLPNPYPKAKYWTMYADGSSITKLEGVGIIVSSPKKDVLKYGV